MKKIIKLTESKLHNIINETVKRILKEYDRDEYDSYVPYDGPDGEVEVDMDDVLQQIPYPENVDEEEWSEKENKLIEELPYVSVYIESSYLHEDYYETGIHSGWVIDSVSIDDNDLKILYKYVQNGVFDEKFIDTLIYKIEEIAEEKAGEKVNMSY